jgi:hypothetical protein
VHVVSQPLVVHKPDELIVSTPMRPAYIMHLDGEGRRVMTAMRWGFSGANDNTGETAPHPRSRRDGGQWTNGTDVLDTFAMLTTPSNAPIARITDRMPAI